MKKIRLTLIIGILISSFGFSQSKSEIENLLDGISKIENSKEITETEEAEKLIEYGWRILPTLAEFFTDQTLTNVKSECQDRILNKGELAIIMADRIEGMPYFTLTGMQNCILTFCENNPNLVEYYLPAILAQGTLEFQKKYNEWLASDDRIDWTPLLTYESKKERRKIIRERKKAIREMQNKK
ncbi:hypothetical protein G3567_13045 [Psychroflexus sp. YR1-1]|uniref:Uncharacterized protein n=1 Tax=Psychroflexus aurantiacus TaxID=2709310 RepID=A0A6B3RC05_9FLAO|nr:hypothetical protein [Psychroflexus aurantiacus]NEV95064.1 hypothetical protein [Psychroflexus aurantiacus]